MRMHFESGVEHDGGKHNHPEFTKVAVSDDVPGLFAIGQSVHEAREALIAKLAVLGVKAEPFVEPEVHDGHAEEQARRTKQREKHARENAAEREQRVAHAKQIEARRLLAGELTAPTFEEVQADLQAKADAMARENREMIERAIAVRPLTSEEQMRIMTAVSGSGPAYELHIANRNRVAISDFLKARGIDS